MCLLIEAVLEGVISIAFFVAAVGIANTMIKMVLERAREIGLMKAVQLDSVRALKFE
jgi:ABC-type antimicrobial peptide transport system permease subunit